jgi:hypothetical protein
VGGTFSGYRSSKKRAVESCNTIDTADLNRWRLLAPGTTRSGSLEWRRGGEEKPSSSVGYTLEVGTEGGTFRLRYQIGQSGERFEYPVRLVTTACHLGGVRWWFVCPLSRNAVKCGRRVRKLYLSGTYFGCRHCHNWAYQSSQESDSRVYAALRSGAHLRGVGDVEGMSVAQMGFTLKVLAAGQKRLDRIGKRFERTYGKRSKRNAETPRP